MDTILQQIDEALALFERRISEMSDPEAVDAMRQAMANVRDARAILEQHQRAMLRPS